MNPARSAKADTQSGGGESSFGIGDVATDRVAGSTSGEPTPPRVHPRRSRGRRARADRPWCRLIVAVQTDSTRDVLWEEMTLADSAAHQSLWVDLTRRAPDEVRAPAASMAAFASWLSGDGAKAWCALDEVPTEKNYPMAAIVAGALHRALPPSEWENRRSLLLICLSAGLDLADLDESYTPEPTNARPQERTSPPSLRLPSQRPPER